MRKLLLASAAMLGAATGGAMAQVPTPAAANMMMQPAQGQMALPWQQGPASNNNNNAYGQPTTYSGGVGFPANVKPTPGTVVIRLNGKVYFEADAFYTNLNTNKGAAPGSTTYKINPIAFGAYMRLYPGVDGMATNGLRYGASVELRENVGAANGQATATGVTGVTAGSGTNPSITTTTASNLLVAGTTASSPGTYSQSQTVFVRRAFTYLALDNVGIVRFGQTDGVLGLFDNCIFYGGCYDAGIGNVNGGQMQGFAPGNTTVPYYWLAQGGSEYSNIKITYLTPQFFGLDFGVQYAPSMGNGYSNSAGSQSSIPAQCTVLNNNCIGLTTGTDGTRWYNQVGVGARYQGKFGPVSVGAYGFYETAAKETVSGVAPTRAGGTARAGGNIFDRLSFVSAATYASLDTPVGQFTAAFDYIGGATNGPLNMRPTGGVAQHAFLPSLTYRNGPLSVGGQFGTVTSQGANALTGISQRHEIIISAGASYLLAPGVYVMAEYMYQARHQGGFDFTTNTVATTTNGVGTRDSRAQGFALATVVNW